MPKKLNIDWDYVDFSQPILRIAQKLGCSINTVNRQKKKFGLSKITVTSLYNFSNLSAERKKARILERKEEFDGGYKSPCWTLSNSRIDDKGYLSTTLLGKHTRVHRITYEVFVGRIPEGLILDHLCRNRNCINPSHLEPVTHRVNTTIRGESPSAVTFRTNICKRGHILSDDNFYLTTQGSRQCKKCESIRKKVYYKNKKVPTRQGGEMGDTGE